MSQYARARAVLEEHRATLQKIADALMEYETIDTADIDILMAGGLLTRTPPVKPMATTQVGERAKPPAPVPAAVVAEPGKA
jgi:cell division protease FtsH